ncbi:hypothetical protein LP420_05660 [Massilia sp. B-10]|nr:hypothetical protein LP420_05660 [Massilia sp. B-10]
MDLQHWLEGKRMPEGHPYRAITAQPQGPTSPAMWILGSSGYGAQLAAQLGLPYAFAYFFSDGQGVEEALALYHQHYRPSALSRAAGHHLRVGAGGRHPGRRRARTDDARALASPLRARLAGPAGLARGSGRLPRASGAERERIARLRDHALVGTGAQVAARIRALAARLGLAEIVVNTWSFDPAVRRHSYALLAQAFNLQTDI